MSSMLESESISQSALDLRADFCDATDVGSPIAHGAVRLQSRLGRKNIWITVGFAGIDVLAIRAGLNAGDVSNVQCWTKPDRSLGIDFTTLLGAMRVKLQFPREGTVRCTTSLVSSSDAKLATMPRDILMLGNDGVVFAAQRGLRSGIVFAGGAEPTPHSVFYFQHFTSLSEFFRETKQTPADSVGGSWPELGFALPAKDAKLPKSREIILSDAYLRFAPEVPQAEDAIARLYLDLLADTYLAIDRPPVDYHTWDARAERALRDLSLSPDCTYVRQGDRFLMPYVGDQTKPPESMVQFTLAVNVGEYDSWRGRESTLGRHLRGTVPAFYNPDIASIVRWLPGEHFSPDQADDNMSHEAMDSWYLHHSLFNLARLGADDHAAARDLFRKSLPFLIRVARRFNYQWPIFFNLKTLEIIRAEAQPGAGGETDVAGMYALVLIHAYEMFGNTEYLREAEIALDTLHGSGFNLAYQLNTTGFAAEAALRMYKMTRNERYLGLAEICHANIFDNMWLWQCDYGHAKHYPTFFGLFPLRDAPYIAPYEELEAHAKFHEYLALGGDDVRPSLRLLIGEFQKYSLHRCWYYYPDALPIDVLAEDVRNGQVIRSLSIPLEDLQDGKEPSGQVGQEIYGAGLPFIMTARHYMNIPGSSLVAYADYPMYDFLSNEAGGVRWRAGGDPRCECEVRIYSKSADDAAVTVTAWTRTGKDRSKIELECEVGRGTADGSVVIGALSAQKQ
jgi:hypothetical protein